MPHSHSHPHRHRLVSPFPSHATLPPFPTQHRISPPSQPSSSHRPVSPVRAGVEDRHLALVLRLQLQRQPPVVTIQQLRDVLPANDGAGAAHRITSRSATATPIHSQTALAESSTPSQQTQSHPPRDFTSTNTSPNLVSHLTTGPCRGARMRVGRSSFGATLGIKPAHLPSTTPVDAHTPRGATDGTTPSFCDSQTRSS